MASIYNVYCFFFYFISRERNRCNYGELNVIFNQTAIKFSDILKHRLGENLRKETQVELRRMANRGQLYFKDLRWSEYSRRACISN